MYPHNVTNAQPLLSVSDSFAAGWHWLSINWHSLGMADPANARLSFLLLAVVFGCWFFAFRRYWSIRKQYGKRELVDVNSTRATMRGELWKLAVRLVVPAMIGWALVNPYLPGAPHRVPAGKRDYAVCIQDSRGMGAPIDSAKASVAGGGQFFYEKGSRLDFVRDVMRGLIKGPLSDTQVSLIAFQGIANVLVPLTDNQSWLLDTLDPKNRFGLRVALSAPLGTGNVDGKLSTIAACFQAARKVLDEQGNKNHQKMIIYFGNGDDISDDGWLADEEKAMIDSHIEGIIYGVGGPPVPIPVYKGEDQQFAGYYKYRDGTEALSGYEEENLLKLQHATGWQYVHLDPDHLPDKEQFINQLTDSKIVIGPWLIFEAPVGTALVFIFGIGLVNAAGSLRGRLRRNRRRP